MPATREATAYQNPFGMTDCYYDREDQHRALIPLLVPGETMWMVLDCKGSGTGFVGITDKRLLFQDANWRKTKNVIVSIPLDRVHAVGVGQSFGLIRSTAQIAIQAGDDDWIFEFRNAEKSLAAYKLLMHMLLNRDTNTPGEG